MAEQPEEPQEDVLKFPGTDGNAFRSEGALVSMSQLAESPASRTGRPDDMPFFTGNWSGTRNDWTGDVGISFIVRANCRITALGRHADIALSEMATVTLWLAETQEVLAVADVGPSSQVEGSYAFEALSSEVEAHAGTEYRLTQRCRGRMPDKWFDGCATREEVMSQTASHCAQFVGGVCRNGYGYPGREDGEHRRAGVVNFKVARVSLELVAVGRAELARRIALAAAAEAPGDRRAAAAYLSVVAGLLALLADELALVPGAAATVVVAEEAALRGLARLEGEAPAAEGAADVADPGFAEALVAAARAGRGPAPPAPGGAPGGPLGAACVVGPDGRVLAASARVLRGGRPAGGAELVAALGAGLVLSRSAAGAVTALLAPEVGRGRALLLAGEAGPP